MHPPFLKMNCQLFPNSSVAELCSEHAIDCNNCTIETGLTNGFVNIPNTILQKLLIALNISINKNAYKEVNFSCPVSNIQVVVPCEAESCTCHVDANYVHNCLLAFMQSKGKQHLTVEELSMAFHKTTEHIGKQLSGATNSLKQYALKNKLEDSLSKPTYKHTKTITKIERHYNADFTTIVETAMELYSNITVVGEILNLELKDIIKYSGLSNLIKEHNIAEPVKTLKNPVNLPNILAILAPIREFMEDYEKEIDSKTLNDYPELLLKIHEVFSTS